MKLIFLYKFLFNFSADRPIKTASNEVLQHPPNIYDVSPDNNGFQ